MSSLLRRIIAVVVVVLLVVIGLAAISSYSNTFKDVHVTTHLKVRVYKELGGANVYNYNSHTPPLFEINSSETLRMKKGVYDFVVNDPAHEYQNPVQKVYVNGDTGNVVVDPVYTDQKLESLLPAERPAARQALLAKYPSLLSYYSFGADRLYLHDDWYGVVLVPNDPQYDQLKILAHKKDGVWTVAAKPAISIGIPSNPSVPGQVISDVDRL